MNTSNFNNSNNNITETNLNNTAKPINDLNSSINLDSINKDIQSVVNNRISILEPTESSNETIKFKTKTTSTKQFDTEKTIESKRLSVDSKQSIVILDHLKTVAFK